MNHGRGRAAATTINPSDACRKVCGSRRSIRLHCVNHTELTSDAWEIVMSYASNAFVAVYQVLDEVLSAQIAPPGAKATIHAIIDDLRRVAASPELVAQTEHISVQLHRLEWAVARGDAALASQARDGLKSIASSWLNYCAA